MGNRGSTISETRTVHIGKYDETLYPDNRVISYKYTAWNFIPKNLFEQLRRAANFYFLCMGVISALLSDSPVSSWTTVAPLVFVVTISAIKQGYEDFLRHRADNIINDTLVSVVRGGVLQEIKCKRLCVGDIVRVKKDENVPCDLVMLISSHSDSKCFLTTANLDGETNLKTVECPIDTDLTVDHLPHLKGSIICEHPTVDLYQFHGNITLSLSEGEGEIEFLNPAFEKEETVAMDSLHGDSCRGRHRCSFSKLHFLSEREYSAPLSADNVLLRGSQLRNTEYIYGCAIYTGEETKLALNSTLTINKFSIVERSINKFLLVFFILLFVEVFLSVGLTFYKVYDTSSWWYLDLVQDTTGQNVIVCIFVYIVLYYYTIPISLYVTMEFQKFLGTFFFEWDVDLMCNGQPAVCKTSDLNEELGQVQYLFSDKTGTLTENEMKFQRCSIDGSMYFERNGELFLLPPSGDILSAIPLSPSKWPPELERFLIAMALCHTVQTLSEISGKMLSDTRNGDNPPEYQASSPDEKALVEAAARCGVVFLGSEAGHSVLSIRGEIKKYRKLQTLEFSSERKRMSVIVSDMGAQDNVWLLCKGAEVSMMPLMVSGHREETKRHYTDFSMRGLRTLVLGQRSLSAVEYQSLARALLIARGLVEPAGREAALTQALDSFERGLTLQGATAVEDRLQERVPETLQLLRTAGIKVWVLTGDKIETALNIAYSCGHFQKGTHILDLIELTNETDCFNTLRELKCCIDKEPLSSYGLVADGSSLKLALSMHPALLQEVALHCESVLCCRLSPKQKAQIVRMVKKSKGRPTVAAVGDGANDVSMIQEANVGIGLMGKEGRQAVRCSDFAFGKFHCLAKAFLVHGQWYYLRAATMVQYFFYKNVVFITPQVFFSLLNEQSQHSLYLSVFLVLFNIIFSTSPIILYSLFEQNYSAKTMLSRPELYKVHRNDRLMSWGQLLQWSLLGFWHSVVIYFVPVIVLGINPIFMWDSTPMELIAFSMTILHNCVLVVNLKILILSSYWTLLFVLAVVLTIITFIIFCWVYNSIIIVDSADSMYDVYFHLCVSPNFWLVSFLTLVLCLIPDLVLKTFQNQKFRRPYFPSWLPTRRKGIFVLPSLETKT